MPCKRCNGHVERIYDTSGHLYTPKVCGRCRSSTANVANIAKQCTKCNKTTTLHTDGEDPRAVEAVKLAPWRCIHCGAEHDEGVVLMPWAMGTR